MNNLMLLDGATGTELGRRGVDVSLPLWSALAIETDPGTLFKIHRDYLAAGADAVTANTFRTQRRTLEKASRPGRRDAAALTRRAVEIARAARDETRPEALVLGSVAPLEDCYRPDLAPRDRAVLLSEHAEHIENLLDAGADLLLIETMNNLAETRAAMTAAQNAAPHRWLVSFCTTATGPPGVLLSGEPLSDLADELRDLAPLAVGVNCIAAPAVEAQLRRLRELLPDQRLTAYAHIAPRYARYANTWRAAGGKATIIGGCCGTTPETIQGLRSAIRDQATPP